MNQINSKSNKTNCLAVGTVEAGLSSPAAIRNKAVMNFVRQNTSNSTRTISGASSSSRINIVTESCSFIPGTFPSTFSLKKYLGPELDECPVATEDKHLGDLGQAASVSIFNGTFLLFFIC